LPDWLRGGGVRALAGVGRIRGGMATGYRRVGGFFRGWMGAGSRNAARLNFGVRGGNSAPAPAVAGLVLLAVSIWFGFGLQRVFA